MGRSLGQMMSQAAPEVKGASYSDKPLGIFRDVRVKVPAQKSCRDVPAHVFKTADEKEIPVESHLELHSCPLGQRGYVQRNLYGFGPDDLGKTRVASITVWAKFTGSGKKVLLLDIRKAEDAKPKFELKFTEHQPWDIPIPFGGGIQFRPLASKPE